MNKTTIIITIIAVVILGGLYLLTEGNSKSGPDVESQPNSSEGRPSSSDYKNLKL